MSRNGTKPETRKEDGIESPRGEGNDLLKLEQEYSDLKTKEKFFKAEIRELKKKEGDYPNCSFERTLNNLEKKIERIQEKKSDLREKLSEIQEWMDYPDPNCPFCDSDFVLVNTSKDPGAICGECEQRFNPYRNKERSDRTGSPPYGVKSWINIEFESGNSKRIPVYQNSIELQPGKIFYKRLDNDSERGISLGSFSLESIQIEFEKENKEYLKRED